MPSAAGRSSHKAREPPPPVVLTIPTPGRANLAIAARPGTCLVPKSLLALTLAWHAMEVRHDDERKRHSVAFVLTVRASNTSAYARSTKAKYASNVDLCIWTLVIEMRLQVTIKSGEETSGQPKRIDLEHTIKGGEEEKKKVSDDRPKI